ncbi:Protein vte6, chloroplastic [Asimina triloba]
MAFSISSLAFPTPLPLTLAQTSSSTSLKTIKTRPFLTPPRPKSRASNMLAPKALSFPQLQPALDLLQASPPTWGSAILSNLLIFLVGSPILVSGLSASGIAAAFLLGTLTWRAFGASGFLLVAMYFVIVSGILFCNFGTAATKLKITQKEAQGVAEKRRGRRGPGSVIGSSAAGCVCAFLSIYGIGGQAFTRLWRLGFVASFCTKLNDTVSSEIGKAYGKTTYLVTTFKIVPRGTEGAVSVEGTSAGLLASVLLAGIAYFIREVTISEAAICVVASQIANIGESLIGAALQDKQGFRWLNNDAVNVINITIGARAVCFALIAFQTARGLHDKFDEIDHRRIELWM